MQSVDPDEFLNTALNGTLRAEPSRGAQGFTVPDVAPGEEFAHVNIQFFEHGRPAARHADHDDRRAGRLRRGSAGPGFSGRPTWPPRPDDRGGFTPGQLPVLNQLASTTR